MVLKPQKFAICFTLGCAFIVGSFFALKGPRSQLSHMLSKETPFHSGILREHGCTIYVSMVFHSYLLSVFFSVLQVMTTFMPSPPAPTYLAFHPQDDNIIAVGMEDSTIQSARSIVINFFNLLSSRFLSIINDILVRIF